MSSCRSWGTSWSSIMAFPGPCPSRCRWRRTPASAASRQPPTRRAWPESMAFKVSSIPWLPRVNSGVARMLPIATTLLAATLAIVPMPVPGYAALTPAFALMAVYHWTIYRPDLLPPIGVFAVGLAQDLLAGAPVGIGALGLLLARPAVLRVRRYFINRTFPLCWTA